MAFTPKAWQNTPSTATPIDATALIDVETRLAAYTDLSRGAVNVKTYGAVGDGTTDDTTAIQNCINANTNVYFPPGTYKVTGLTSSTAGLTLRGAGFAGQDKTLANGLSQILVSGANVGFTFNPAASSTLFAGPMIVDLHFKPVVGNEATALGGVLIKRSNNYKIYNVNCSDFTAGYGFKHDGTGNVNQYGTMIDCGASSCLIGIDLLNTNGLRIIGGMIDANSNSGSVRASSTGIRIGTGGDTTKIMGMVVQFAAIGIDIQGSDSCEIVSCRLEGCTTLLKNAGTNTFVVGSTFNNFIIGSGGTALDNQAGGTGLTFMPNSIAAVATQVTDATATTVSLIGSLFKLPTAGQFHILSGDTILTRKSSGNLKVTNNVYANSHFVSGDGGTGNYYVNGAAGPYISAGTGSPLNVVTAPIGSMYFRTDGGASTTLYVKESGTGASTGWVAK
jgi:hypothetical protein